MLLISDFAWDWLRTGAVGVSISYVRLLSFGRHGLYNPTDGFIRLIVSRIDQAFFPLKGSRIIYLSYL